MQIMAKYGLWIWSWSTGQHERQRSLKEILWHTWWRVTFVLCSEPNISWTRKNSVINPFAGYISVQKIFRPLPRVSILANVLIFVCWRASSRWNHPKEDLLSYAVEATRDAMKWYSVVKNAMERTAKRRSIYAMSKGWVYVAHSHSLFGMMRQGWLLCSSKLIRRRCSLKQWLGNVQLQTEQYRRSRRVRFSLRVTTKNVQAISLFCIRASRRSRSLWGLKARPGTHRWALTSRPHGLFLKVECQ